MVLGMLADSSLSGATFAPAANNHHPEPQDGSLPVATVSCTISLAVRCTVSFTVRHTVNLTVASL